MKARESTTLEKNLVLVGGGHSHVEVLRSFAMHPVPGLRLTLVSPGAATYYSGMLPGYIAGEYSERDICIDLEPLAQRANALFYRAKVLKCDPEASELELENVGRLGYDIVSFDIGSVGKKIPIQDECCERIIATRPFPRLLEQLAKLDEVVREAKSPVRICCVGAGAAGFELALALEKRYANQGLPPRVKVELVDGGSRLNARKLAILGGRGISVIRGKPVREIVDRGSHLELFLGAEMLKADSVLWAAGPSAPPLFQGMGSVASDGFLLVNEKLQSVHYKNIFGAGDCIRMERYPSVAKSGVYAVREGPILARNLRAQCGLGKAVDFRPQKRFLRLLNLGDKSAVLQYGAVEFRAPWLWNWKDSIDRKFMRKYSPMPLAPMRAPDCGGCGGKVGADVLEQALACLKPQREKEKFSNLLAAADDIAIVELGNAPVGVSIDYFKDLGINPYLLGQIAASHAVSDFFAKGIYPKYALANLVVPRSSARISRTDLEHLLQGAKKTFDFISVSIVGGQSTVGESFAAGFTILGEAGTEPIWKKQGAHAGDALLLTKPLGTGILLAAAMRGAVFGPDFEICLRSMCDTHANLLPILRKYSIHAATDTTGFGLAGHLRELLGKAGQADLDLGNMPVYSGARELAAIGYLSRMGEENRRAFPGFPEDPLLYDPQTSGGLLIALPVAEAKRCLSELRQHAPHARQIGCIK